MQTIILTDNKRLSTDYYADKTIFAQKIDINHILNTEVYQSHISKVRFWIIRTNVHNQETFVHQLCKNLVNRGNTSISFEFSITKIALGHQAPYHEEKNNNTSILNDRYLHRNPQTPNSSLISPNPIKNIISFSQHISVPKSSSHTKANSNLQWAMKNQSFHNQERKAQQKQGMESPTNGSEEVVNLKPLFRKQFELGSLSELSAVFMSKEGIYNEFNLHQENIIKSQRMITSYIFRQNEVEIGLSVVSEGCKKYVQKAINLEISQTFNKQFNSRKQAYESKCVNENFSSHNIPKSTAKIAAQIPKQTYHKILLFLFSHYDQQTQKSKVSSTNLSQPMMGNKQNSKFINAIHQWKMKDQDINIAEKLSKQYVLIKQQVENQKVSFKNKLKIFQAIIGESVNVEKLLNQEKQMETNGSIKPPENTNNTLNPNINAQENTRASRKSELKSMLNSPQQMASSTNSEFKRLKQSFEMIRNIDNIINQQNKKIETLKLYQKQIIKSKNQMLYKSAKALNQVKKQIKQIKEQMQQKQIEHQFKLQKLQKQKNGKKRNFNPTSEAQALLEENVKLFKQIIQNQKTNINNEKYLLEDEKEKNGKENQDKNFRLKASESQNKKGFFIRKHLSNHSHLKNASTLERTLEQTFSKQKQAYQCHSNISSSTLATLYKSEQQKQIKLMKKRRQQIENNNIWHSVQLQQNKKSHFEEKSQEMSNAREKQVLVALYDYYKKNNELLMEVQKQLSTYKIVDNPKMDMTMKSSSNGHQSFSIKQRSIHSSLHTRGSSQKSVSHMNTGKSTFDSQRSAIQSRAGKERIQIKFPEIDLEKFPILKDILFPKNSTDNESEEMSVISDMISQNKVKGSEKARQFGTGELSQKKRITLENMVNRK